MKVFSKFRVGIFKGRGRVGVLVTPPWAWSKQTYLVMSWIVQRIFQLSFIESVTLWPKSEIFCPLFNQLNILAHY